MTLHWTMMWFRRWPNLLGQSHACISLPSLQALEWQASRSAQTVIEERERMIRAIEQADAKMRGTGWRDQWFCGSDPIITSLSGEVNGQLMEDLAAGIGFPVMECVEYFRTGVRLYMCSHVC